MPKSERILLWSLAAASLVLRVLAFFRYRFDSDEQQHAHVAWAWTDGLVQYRDVFDNHMPLFHLLAAPFVALFGERSDILLWLRLPMLALFGIVLWSAYVVAGKVWNARVAAWAVVLLSLFPPFFLKSLEFRNDNLWVALCMLALVALFRGWRQFVIGLLLGGALATSIKTSVLLVALLAAALITQRWRNVRWLELLAGFAIVPAVLAICFAAAGAWDELVYCNFTFNSHFTRMRKNIWIGAALFPFFFAAIVWLARRYRDRSESWLYVTLGVYAIALPALGVPISPRDFLPFMPLAAMFVAAAIKSLRSYAIVAAAFIAALWYYADRFENKTDWHTTMMDQALRLTRPGEMLMDIKGETIFRRRPFYFVFENLTRAQIARGIIRDTVPEDVIRNHTHVAQADGPMWPPHARAFLSANFMDMGRLRASGQWIKDDGSFTIAVPGEYVIINERGEARGLLDETPYTKSRELAAGAHRFVRARNEKLAVLWAPAFRRAHSPFHHRDREF